jgi:hypothetical protein
MYYTDYRIVPSSMRSAMDRDGEMSKLRAMSGLRISSSPCVSSYIIEKRIRKILDQYTKCRPSSERKSIDRMVTKLDKLDKSELEYLHHIGTEESVEDMVSVLKMTHSNITKLSSAWANMRGDNLL